MYSSKRSMPIDAVDLLKLLLQDTVGVRSFPLLVSVDSQIDEELIIDIGPQLRLKFVGRFENAVKQHVGSGSTVFPPGVFHLDVTATTDGRDKNHRR